MLGRCSRNVSVQMLPLMKFLWSSVGPLAIFFFFQQNHSVVICFRYKCSFECKGCGQSLVDLLTAIFSTFLPAFIALALNFRENCLLEFMLKPRYCWGSIRLEFPDAK